MQQYSLRNAPYANYNNYPTSKQSYTSSNAMSYGNTNLARYPYNVNPSLKSPEDLKTVVPSREKENKSKTKKSEPSESSDSEHGMT